jgi:hypothetical protein
MNYYFTGILIVLFCLLAFVKPAYPDSTQTNTSGSNTAIEGGYTSSSATTYQSGSSSNTTKLLLIILMLNLHHQQHLHHHSLLNHKTFVQQEYQ